MRRPFGYSRNVLRLLSPGSVNVAIAPLQFTSESSFHPTTTTRFAMLRFSIRTKPNLFFLSAAMLLNAGALTPKWEPRLPFRTFSVAPATGFADAAAHVLIPDQTSQKRTILANDQKPGHHAREPWPMPPA
jgi:hypothetical protein